MSFGTPLMFPTYAVVTLRADVACSQRCKRESHLGRLKWQGVSGMPA